ncbi:MAG TPA: sigma-70 family RNA polymerase sigma factor [Xanthobacteraceae bacterium]|jgi:RNA polymerase sigma factor (sigma-70 family)|nr:sigma-70 family RNA polymerase sigma factor [Xanthobacteraceae bacterium]
MTETAWAALRQILAERYDDLCTKLARRLNSQDLARETLHDTWLHLLHKEGSETIQNPAGYLLRTAFNIALDRQRKTSRLARSVEIEAFLNSADETPGPAQILEAQQEMDLLRRALAELTPRRRFILLASRIEGTPLRQIAEQLGISQRMVDMELRQALRHCALRLRKHRRK